MRAAICTLFEGDYHLGVGALLNSLYAAGYRGVVYAGYRGDIPPWADRASRDGVNTRWEVAEGMSIVFTPVTTDVHLTHYKPSYMTGLFDGPCRDSDALFYFDPDITVKAQWAFFEAWVGNGVALCQDMNGWMDRNHPIRSAWTRLLEASGLHVVRDVDSYYNAGFVGVHRNHRQFLDLWRVIISAISGNSVSLKELHTSDRTDPFYLPDQDALNMTVMVAPVPVSPVGQDGMDFQTGGGSYIMSHAAGGRKPWRRRYVFEVITRGFAPSRADRLFWAHTKAPIRLFGTAALLFRQLDLKGGALLGRIL